MSTSSQRTIDIPIVVNAWGVSAGQAPHFRLLVDGVMIGEAWVAATSSTPYRFTATVDPDQAHRISIWYDNDGVVNGVDRNLFVGSITVDGQEVKSTDARATYDKGAVDGKDVVPGQVGLYWGGLLSFGLGEEMFGGPLVRPPPKPDEVITRPIPITVEAARGASATGPVRFKVLVDGKPVGEAEVTSGSAERFTFGVTLDPSVAHTVRILPVSGTQAGDLTIGGVAVNGKSLAAPAPAQDGSVTLAVAAPVFQGTASDAAAPQGDAFYVAKNGNDAWSGRLAAPNAEGTDGPFASLERAQAAMRAGTVKTTYVREGSYNLTGTLTLGAPDSGVRILGYPGEQAVLSGGERVTGFTYEGNGVWSAPLSAAPGLDVTVDGARYRLASKAAYDPQDPTTGWFVADASAYGASKNALRYRAGDVTAADLVPGSRVQVFDTERLQDAILTVAGIDTVTRTLTFTADAPFTMRDGSTFKLLGNSAHVDQVGEFAYRASDGRLVIKAGEEFNGTGVEVARLGTLMRLNGANGVTVQGLTFTNTTTDGNALDVLNGDVNTIAGNSFVNVGTGIRLTQGADRNLVSGNYLDHLGINGIALTGQSIGNTVTGNRIQHIGEVRKYAGGIMASGISDTVISHNDIDHSARYGISVKNWDTATISLNNAILHNRVRNTGLETADSGGIELLGRSNLNTGTRIEGNRVEHTGGIATTSTGQWLRDYKGYGIYLDDLTSGVTVQGNFLRDTAWAAVMIHGGHDNTVTNNIGVLGANGESFIRIEWVPLAGAAGIPANNTVTGNLVSGAVPLGGYVTILSAGQNAIDANFLHQVGAYGANDRAGDPLFADAYNHDYSLLPLSPALTAGLQDLAWTLMGIVSGGGTAPPQDGGGTSPLPPSDPQANEPPAPVPVPQPDNGTPAVPPAPSPTPTPAAPSVSAPLPDPAPARPSVPFSRIVDGVQTTVAAYAYEGPVTTLQWSFLGTAEDEVVGGSDGNDFINLMGGNDAAWGGAGDDVLDGGSGSNWLIGGPGHDTFFVDGRGGEVTWSTIVDLERGEWATLWGFVPGQSRLTWEEMGGAEGYKGATVRCDIDGNGTIDASMTFTGLAVSAMTVTTGMAGSEPYIAFITL
ncbi:secreted sugar hydrolase-like protein (modular protein) (plasmid) [Azospirillum sp. TSH58]|uniref:carbohydrate-binding domain-containing protein n=1 Tax=Azospirillum sp. TSH58 TaxID=664962 RepID=UPI000D5FF3FC|nr:carbohydrate-binding domain-containing protein [Azospirillum sp. TSH58]AWJ85488.1 secreted sugar hydrolase-like protein (modular protein) [Azospirillum sp. TSH58]